MYLYGQPSTQNSGKSDLTDFTNWFLNPSKTNRGSTSSKPLVLETNPANIKTNLVTPQIVPNLNFNKASQDLIINPEQTQQTISQPNKLVNAQISPEELAMAKSIQGFGVGAYNQQGINQARAANLDLFYNEMSRRSNTGESMFNIDQMIKDRGAKFTPQQMNNSLGTFGN